MAKSLVVGNGNILLCLDVFGQLKDFYYPYVGLENHIGRGLVHKIGVFVDGHTSWLSDFGWNISIDYVSETMQSRIVAENSSLEVILVFSDVVHNERNVFVRMVDVTNTSNRKRTIKLFFNQQFQISESRYGDTAYYSPKEHVIIHYKGKRVFLISGKLKDRFFDDYSIGLLGIEGREGTWRDAEDGLLSKNPIEHGSVDSVVSFTVPVEGKKSQTVIYWIAVAEKFREVIALHEYIQEITPQHVEDSAAAFWKAWVNKRKFEFYGLTPETVSLFKKSLLIIRAHADREGAIIASGDSDILQGGRDTYSYVWTRDGTFAALALDKAGYFDTSKRFYQFCSQVLTDEGYILHKYRADRSLASSWHPWIRDGVAAPPIQEDETALPIIMLWEHYQATKDLEFIESIYNSFIKKSADFFLEYRDLETGLPQRSHELWEERHGVSCFTSSAVYGALVAAAHFSHLLGKEVLAARYTRAAEEMQKAILASFCTKEQCGFYRLINADDAGAVTSDTAFDISSVYGLFRFGVIDKDDPRLEKAFKRVDEQLRLHTSVGGICRYEGDKFYQIDPNLPGNPWFITTFWLLEYKIARAQHEEELMKIASELSWATRHARHAGVLSEQLHPHTGEQLSVAPLVWSHAGFVLAVVAYLEKLEELGICKTCYPVGHDHTPQTLR